MLKVQEGLKWGNGFTYKFEFHSVSMTLIFGHATNVLLMLNNNFTHQIFLLTPVFITNCVSVWHSVVTAQHAPAERSAARREGKDSAVVR